MPVSEGVWITVLDSTEVMLVEYFATEYLLSAL